MICRFDRLITAHSKRQKAIWTLEKLLVTQKFDYIVLTAQGQPWPDRLWRPCYGSGRNGTWLTEKLQYNNSCILVIEVQVFPQQVNYQSVRLISHAQNHDQDLISQAIVVLIYIIYCITGKFGGNIVWWKWMNNNFGKNKFGE